MDLKELIEKDGIKCEELILGYLHKLDYHYLEKVSIIDKDTNEKRYGLKLITLKNIVNTKELPGIQITDIMPLEYTSIKRCERNGFSTNLSWFVPIILTKKETDYVELKILKADQEISIIDSIGEKEKFKSIQNMNIPPFLLATDQDDKFSLFTIVARWDEMNTKVPKIKYEIKGCTYMNCSCFSFRLLKENKSSITTLEYDNFDGGMLRNDISGNLISFNENYFISKHKNKFTLIERSTFDPLATYENSDIVDMQLCQYDGDMYTPGHEVMILTDKNNKKRVLSASIDAHFVSFTEIDGSFDDINYNFNFILDAEDEDSVKVEEGFQLDACIGNEKYQILIRPNGESETFEIVSNELLLEKKNKTS